MSAILNRLLGVIVSFLAICHVSLATSSSPVQDHEAHPGKQNISEWKRDQAAWASRPRGYFVCAPSAIKTLVNSQQNKDEVIWLENQWNQLQAAWTNQPIKFKSFALNAVKSVTNDNSGGVAQQRKAHLFTMVTCLPIPSFNHTNEISSDFYFNLKWNTLDQMLRDTPSLDNTSSIWMDFAWLLGDVRSNIIEGYKCNNGINGVFGLSDEQRIYVLDLQNWTADMGIYQMTLEMTCRLWTQCKIVEIREFASKLPPEKRKVFLDEIARRAKSDAKEIELLNKPLS
ncbi:MAG: hypothetical protein WCJ02_15315 [bacterium]